MLGDDGTRQRCAFATLGRDRQVMADFPKTGGAFFADHTLDIVVSDAFAETYIHVAKLIASENDCQLFLRLIVIEF